MSPKLDPQHSKIKLVQRALKISRTACFQSQHVQDVRTEDGMDIDGDLFRKADGVFFAHL